MTSTSDKDMRFKQWEVNGGSFASSWEISFKTFKGEICVMQKRDRNWGRLRELGGCKVFNHFLWPALSYTARCTFLYIACNILSKDTPHLGTWLQILLYRWTKVRANKASSTHEFKSTIACTLRMCSSLGPLVIKFGCHDWKIAIVM